MHTNINEIDRYKTKLEIIMMALCPHNRNSHAYYLAGVIDTWLDCSLISVETHEELSIDYGPH